MSHFRGPRYEVEVDPQSPVFSVARLRRDGRVVCQTTVPPGVTKGHPDVCRMVAGYLHQSVERLTPSGAPAR